MPALVDVRRCTCHTAGPTMQATMLEDHRTTQDPLKPHQPPADEPPDAAEIWGKRIGRTFGFLFALYLIYSLLTNYVWK